MSTLGGGNGDGWPPEGGGQPDGLPGLPPEWGNVVIPDDPAELATEAATVRRELRRDARRARWRRRLGLPPRPAGDETQPSLGLPLLIMSIAVIATLTSLFAVAWPGRGNHPALNPRASRNASFTSPGGAIPDLTLTDLAGAPVRLTDATPAAVLLVDGCRCADLVAATAAAAPRAVTVLLVGHNAPTLWPAAGRPPASAGSADHAQASTAPGGSALVRSIADPRDQLRSALGLGPPGNRATVLLVSASGEIVRTVPGADSVETFRKDLAQLL